MAERSDFPAEFYGFEPVWGRDSRALILGTWPSPKSRAQGFYYGHPQKPVLAPSGPAYR